MRTQPRDIQAISVRRTTRRLLRTSWRASMKTFAMAGKTGAGKRCSRWCFPPVLPSVSAKTAGKSGGCIPAKTVKRHGAAPLTCVHARARVGHRMFYRFTVLDRYYLSDNVGQMVKTLGKTGARKAETTVLPFGNPLKTRKKGGFRRV